MPPMRRVARFLGGSVIAIATIGVIVGVLVGLLLTPLWVFGEQDRAGSAALTGYTAAVVRIATGAILGDLVVGPPDFDVTIRDQAVLNEAERGHLRDVQVTFQAFFAVIAVAAVVLLLARWRSHGSALYWRGVRIGASILAVTIAALAGFAVVAFALLFEVFHQVLFPPGSYTFDPATDRLVQLFPERFWFDTTIVLAIGLILFSLATRALAGRRLAAIRARADEAAAPIEPPGSDGPAITESSATPGTQSGPSPAGT
jgi:integral membrane protein (TIGR01906 family)